ncbi:DUF5696 domain-containing protein [Paenibacillus sp.]|uniref:DUF5696 domain-containing protein n=1 Tax=Paenibacillus sp. TaxID=58172 RepID=UPI002811A627|nr:DUF5696 domain-containing protein [Paenibacillus sp.]
MAINFLNRRRLARSVKLLLFGAAALWLAWWIIPDSGMQTEFSSDPFQPAAQPEGGELPMAEGFQTYASDGRFELLADAANQQFAIKDAASGLTWASSPDPTGVADIRPLVARNIRSPFEIVYTADFSKTQQTGVNNDETTWKAYKIENGIQFHYELKELNIAFIAEFVLEDGGFYVRIPDEGIRESDEGSALVSIKVLPMFGAALQGEEGYMVVPDGSGALVYFDRLHNQAASSEYFKWIYGADPTFDPMDGPPLGESVAVPAFGIVKSGGGVVQTIQRGAADAKVIVSPPGIRNNPFFRGGFEFAFRKQYVTSYGESTESAAIERIERSLIRSERVVRFDFASGERTAYADLATLAGDALLGTTKTVGEAPPPMIQIFLGVESRGDSYSKRMETMTTFSEAQRMMEELKRGGVESFSAELKGWQNQGYYGSLPRRFPIEEAFGGERGLTELIEWMDRNGIAASLEDNYSDVYRRERDGVRLRTDAVRRPDGRVFVHYPDSAAGSYRRSSEWYKVSPYSAEQDYLPQSLEKLDSVDVRSINMRYVGEALMSDYNDAHPLRRWETQAYYERWLGSAKEKLGSVGVYYGNVYAVKHADRVLDIPLRSSPNYLLDEHIPFLQMVYHGRVPYFSSALNRSDDARLELLKAIEYGAIPAFELTYRTTTDLRYTNYDFLFSAQYETWMPEVSEAYAAWAQALKPVATERMTGHERIAEGIFKTTYADGTHVWVNYNEQAATVEGVTVEPLGYAVREGGEIE